MRGCREAPCQRIIRIAILTGVSLNKDADAFLCVDVQSK